MKPILLAIFALCISTPTIAQQFPNGRDLYNGQPFSSGRDLDNGRSSLSDPYGDRRDTYRRSQNIYETQPAPSNRNPAWQTEPPRVNIYSPTGEQRGTGRIESDGTITNEQTGRRDGFIR